MILLTAENISKSYSEKDLLKNITLAIGEGEKIGLIGVNGTGKSTLLKIMAGQEEPDSGTITRARGLRIGYLPQNPEFRQGDTVLGSVLKAMDESFQNEGQYQCKTMLTRLGMDNFDEDVHSLSGGQRKRVALAAALVRETEMLILDEPTNHIDNDMTEWLEKYLSSYRGAILMVTHDRYFLDRVTNKIGEIRRNNLNIYAANYSKYLEQRAEREDSVAAAERKIKELYKRELEWISRGARARSTKAQYRVDRFAELKDRSSLMEERRQVEISAASSRLGKKIVEIDSISKSYGNKVLIDNLSYSLLRNDRVGIIGPNGCGKSTLLKIIADKINPDSGAISRGDTVKIGYFSQEAEEMDTTLRVIEYAEDIARVVHTSEGEVTASQMLEKFLFDKNMQRTTISRLSGGERRRLYLLGILMESPNVLLLDEPTNDLDIDTLTILEEYIMSFAGAVMVVSHDRYFLDKVSEHVFVFDGRGQIKRYVGGYTDYRQTVQSETEEKEETKSIKNDRPRERKPGKLKFTYKEQQEYDRIDADIAALESELAEVEKQMDQKSADYMALQELTTKKESIESSLSEKMDRWVYLNDLSEKIAEQNRKD